MIASWFASPDVVGNNATKSHKPGLEVVQSAPVPLLPPFLVDCQRALRVYLASVVLRDFARGGRLPKLHNLGVQGSESRPQPRFRGVWDLFLRRYNFLRPKFLHVAWVEHQGATVGSLHVVRCHYMVIFRVLG